MRSNIFVKFYRERKKTLQSIYHVKRKNPSNYDFEINVKKIVDKTDKIFSKLDSKKIKKYKDENPDKEKIKNDTGKQVLDDPIYFIGTKNNIEVECSLVWNATYSEQVMCFTNNIPQKDGGTHLLGFRNAITGTF